jgi:hypothetical protein
LQPCAAAAVSVCTAAAPARPGKQQKIFHAIRYFFSRSQHGLLRTP